MIRAARAIAFRAHAGQSRKYTGVPYADHLGEVAYITSLDTEDARNIAAAWLHDTVEDTYYKQDKGKSLITDLIRDFSVDESDALYILDTVTHLTDVYTSENYPEMNRAERKREEAHRLASAPVHAKRIKLADHISNLNDVAHFDKGFAKVYVKEIDYKINLMFPAPDETPLYKLVLHILQRTKKQLI